MSAAVYAQASQGMRRRPDRDAYYMGIAKAVSTRATCDRAAVGAVLVRDDRIISTGYNGAPRGLPHCDDVGHDLENGHCVRVIHSERNAIIQAAYHGVPTKGAICYCTMRPCSKCSSDLYAAGIREVVYEKEYETMSPEDLARIALLEGAGMIFRKLEVQCGQIEG